MTLFDLLRVWARAIKRDIVALWLAARDPRVPWYAKLIAGVVAAYALSPIDLIPDFIPILGYLDDLLIVPSGMVLALKFIPDPVIAHLRAQALKVKRPTSTAGLLIVVATWLAAIALVAWQWWPA